jgi:hypothetical protein
MAVWFGAKNNIDEEYIKENYTNKSYLQRVKVYFTYTSLVAASNMLKIYF